MKTGLNLYPAVHRRQRPFRPYFSPLLALALPLDFVVALNLEVRSVVELGLDVLFLMGFQPPPAALLPLFAPRQDPPYAADGAHQGKRILSL